jgi:hypothetical protein
MMMSVAPSPSTSSSSLTAQPKYPLDASPWISAMTSTSSTKPSAARTGAAVTIVAAAMAAAMDALAVRRRWVVMRLSLLVPPMRRAGKERYGATALPTSGIVLVSVKTAA